MQQLNSMDSLFLQAELPGLPMLVSSVGIYDPSTSPDARVRFKDILQVFENGIPETSLFRRRLVSVPFDLDNPYWIEDPDFDVEFHVRHIALPFPGDWRQLFIQLARLQSRPLDKSRPLWEAYVIEGLNNLTGIPEGSFCVMLKVHHAAMDGMGAMDILTSMHDLSPSKPSQRIRNNTVMVEHRPNRWALLNKALSNQLKRSIAGAKQIGGRLTAWNRVRSGIEDGEFQQAGPRVRTRFNTSASPYRSIGKFTMDLASIEQICRATACSPQDVMLSLVSGAMQKYLGAKNELPQQSLSAGFPVRARQRPASSTPGNAVNFIDFSLSTDIADPIQRLQAIKQSSAEARARHTAAGINTIGGLIEVIPPVVTSIALKTMLGASMRGALEPVFNTIVQYIPGVKIPVYLGGAKMIDAFALGPVTNGLGLFHTITSLYDRTTIAVTACRQMLPDPAFYRTCIQKSYLELLEAVQQPTATEKPPEPAKPAHKRKSAKAA